MNNFYFIPAVFSPNTAATNRTLSYIKGLSELGVETNVVFFRANDNYDKIEKAFNFIHVKYYWNKTIHSILFFKYIHIFFSIIFFLLKLKNGDIVYCYGNAEIWSLILKLRKKVHVYVEYTEHPEITGIGGSFLTPSIKKFYKQITKVDGIFVITTALHDLFVSKGVDSKKIHIANITIDPNRFTNLSKTNLETPYIGYCGVVSNKKDGIDLLLQSFSIVAENYPDIKLYIMGKILHEEDKNVNESLIKDLGIVDKVIFKGVVSAKEMPQVLKNAELLVLNRPNNLQAKYGFATKVGEYLLSESPVVLTDVGDFSIFLKDGVDVIFSKPDDPEIFAEKIMWVLSHQKQAAIIGKQGAKTAEKYFSYKNVVSGIIKEIGLK